MTQTERTCIRCGATVAPQATRCPVCGADPDVGTLVVRREYLPALPWRQLVRPVAAGVTIVAAGAGLRLLRRLLPRLRLRRARLQPPAVVKEEKPDRGRVIAIRRRIWAIGDKSGTRQWGSEETVWHAPPESASSDSHFRK